MAEHVVELGVGLGRGRHVAERVAQLVDERHVLDGDACTRAGVDGTVRPRLEQQALLLGLEDPVGHAAQQVGVAQPREHVDRGQRGPPGAGEVEEGAGREEVLVEVLPPQVAAALRAHLAPQGVEQRARHPRQLTVAEALAHELAPDAAQRGAVEHEAVVAPEQGELARGVRGLLAGEAPHDLGHPLRALDVGDPRLVVAARAHAVDDLAERAQRHGGLAEARQHALDVAHEHAAGPDHEHAARLEPAAVVVEQEGGAVQRDDRLAGAGTARDGDDALRGGPDGLVLLRLDGRDDRVHRAVAGPGELRHERALADDRQRAPGSLLRLLGLGVEQLVLDALDDRARRAQHATAHDALGVRRGRLVEHRGRRGPPVDEQHVVVLVAQADAADVARLRVALARQVEPSEHQALVRGVELGDALRRLEDHRVALDEPALVAETAALVALVGEPAGPGGRRHELRLHVVDERLLGGDLPLRDLLVGALSLSRVLRHVPCPLPTRHRGSASPLSGGADKQRIVPPPRVEQDSAFRWGDPAQWPA
ncbi:hypothetical protein [Nocardioides zeae]